MTFNSVLYRTLTVILAMLFISSAAAFADSGLETALSMQKAFVEVAKQLKPSVVNIRVERSESGGIRWSDPQGRDSEGVEEFFRKFFGNPGQRFNRPEPFKSQAAGSGVVFAEDGLILTNNHVVKDASKITVKFNDGVELDAEIVGQDPQTDLAVVRVKSTKPLKVAAFADSEQVEVGQWCIAVGNPLGLEQTVTVGVVSALGRSGIGATAIEDFIQTDASINPGNSGGPLVNLRGQVIGINTLIFNAPGSGIGFAIPSNMASRISQQIASGGKVQRPFIGITMQPITDELAGHYGIADRDGAVVMQLVEDGPAAKAGVKPMDIIRKIDGKPMKSTSDVQKHVLGQDVGKEIAIEILRNGKVMNFKVALEQMPETYGLAASEVGRNNQGRASGGNSELGFKLQAITPDLARAMGIKESSGLVITSVSAGSPAEKSGLKTGDLVSQINGVELKTEQDAEKALKEGKKKNSSVFLVSRSGIPMFIVIQHGSGK